MKYIYDYEKIQNAKNQLITKGNYYSDDVRECVMRYWARLNMSNINPYIQNIEILNEGIFKYNYNFLNKFVDIDKILKDNKLSLYILNDNDCVIYKNTKYFNEIEFNINDKLYLNNLGLLSYHITKDTKKINYLIGNEHFLNFFENISDFCIPIRIENEIFYFLFMMQLYDFNQNKIEIIVNYLFDILKNTSDFVDNDVKKNGEFNISEELSKIFPIVLTLDEKNYVINKIIDNSDLFNLGDNVAEIFGILNLNNIKETEIQTIIDDENCKIKYEELSRNNNLKIIKLSKN